MHNQNLFLRGLVDFCHTIYYPTRDLWQLKIAKETLNKTQQITKHMTDKNIQQRLLSKKHFIIN